jgi:hypothetical protein
MRTDRWRSSQHMDDMARTAGTKANPVEEPQLLGLLTTQADAEVGAAHPKAMPVILTSVEGTRPHATDNCDCDLSVWATRLGRPA